MSIKRVVSTQFWTDEKVLEEFTPEDKYFMLYLLTNPHTTQLGIYKVPRKLAAFEMGYSIDAVNTLFERFEKYGIIKISKETGEVAIMNYLAYAIVKGGKPVKDCMLKELKEVRDKELAKAVGEHLLTRNDLLSTASDFIPFLLSNENDNENENEERATIRGTYGDRTETVRETHSPLYGKYGNVSLTESEYQLIQDTYEEPTKLIDHMSNWLARSTKECNNHFAMIEHIADTDGWAKKRKAEPVEQVEAVPMPEEVREKLNSFLK